MQKSTTESNVVAFKAVLKQGTKAIETISNPAGYFSWIATLTY
jgi:hypothetical protein